MLELDLIGLYYGKARTKRSKVPLMNHITEGLDILDVMACTDLVKRAYCIHPMVQADVDLVKNIAGMETLDGRVVALAMEYRRVANAYLSPRIIKSIDEIELSPLEDVNDMLRADKLQNEKDFRKYHLGTHPRSKELEEYFANWFKRLDLA
jgi:hypothetical protein